MSAIYTQYELEEMHQIELAKHARASECLRDTCAEFYIISALGRRSQHINLQVTLSDASITIYVRQDAITRAQLRNALAIHFPRHTFYARETGSFWVADADRWAEDGVELRSTVKQ